MLTDNEIKWMERNNAVRDAQFKHLAQGIAFFGVMTVLLILILFYGVVTKCS